MQFDVTAALGGRYVLERRIAVGGMGEVWEASDQVLDRRVAVKVLRDDLVGTLRSRERFRLEARHAAALSHPSVAVVHDYGEQVDEDGRLTAYIVMELVRGLTLAEVLARRGPLPVDTALSILAQAADALAAAHELGIVHRDVKPGNVLIVGDSIVKVTDFGIARAVDGTDLTMHGQVLGTPTYISPEQAMGGRATPSSDLYSLGVIAYEMVAGRPPFSATHADVVLTAHLHQLPPPLLPSVPAGVAMLIDQLLAKDPAARPLDARSVAAQARQLRATITRAAGPEYEHAPLLPGALPTVAFDTPVQDPSIVTPGPIEPGSPTVVMPAAMAPSAPCSRANAARHGPHRRRRLGRGALVLAGVAAGAIGIVLGLRASGPLAPRPTAPTVAVTVATGPPTTATAATSAVTTPPPTSATTPAVAPDTTRTKPGKGKGKSGG